MTQKKFLKIWMKSYNGISSKEIANDLLSSLILVIKTALRHGKFIDFISLGKLKPVIRKGGKNYNYKTKKYYMHGDKITVKFIIDKNFKDLLNMEKKK